MDGKNSETGHELEEDEEEFDEGYEDRIAQIEKNMENVRGTINEDRQKESLGHNAFSRELGPPEPFTEDRIVSSDEVEKMVIDETKSEVEDTVEDIDIMDKELTYERINPEGQFEQLSEEQFKEALKEDSLIEGSIEEAKFENDLENSIEVYKTYDQPELVRQWEETYHSEKEEVLSEEALGQLQQSMDSMEGVGGVEAVNETANDDVGAFESLSDHISSEGSGEVDSQLGNELDSELDEDLDLELDLDLDMDADSNFGSNI